MKTASLLFLSASVALTSITVVAAMFSGIAMSLGQHHFYIRPDDSDADTKARDTLEDILQSSRQEMISRV